MFVGIYVSVIQLLNGAPQIMLRKQDAHFVGRCEQQTSHGYLDHNGQLSVAVWNIFKQKRQLWQNELTQLTDYHQLVLLQEAKLNTSLYEFINKIDQHVAMAKAFKILDTPMGVMNLSKTKPESACVYRQIEPIIRFAKSSLVAEYPLSNGKTILVVNLHGVNFDLGLRRYQAQIRQVFNDIESHQGPVLFAGDFNTWRKERLHTIQHLAIEHGLHEVRYEIDVRKRVLGLPLDHLYYRDLNLIEANSLPTTASDHTPIQAKFSI